MADIRDEHGHPIQLTDELGRPVQLTDEHGVPMHLTGVATTTVDSGPHGGTTTIGSEPKMHGGNHFAPKTAVGAAVEKAVPCGGAPLSHPETGGAEGEKQQLGPSGSSSSSSSEDDEGGGRRRKKKGLMKKIKEKLPGYKDKEQQTPAMVYSSTTKTSVTTPAGPPEQPRTEYIRVEHHEEEHEKKGFMDKIKDKLPGHHSH